MSLPRRLDKHWTWSNKQLTIQMQQMTHQWLLSTSGCKKTDAEHTRKMYMKHTCQPHLFSGFWPKLAYKKSHHKVGPTPADKRPQGSSQEESKITATSLWVWSWILFLKNCYHTQNIGVRFKTWSEKSILTVETFNTSSPKKKKSCIP